MKFRHAVPILFSSDVTRSITYYRDQLGFEREWTWGHPPGFGGVSKDGIDLFFCHNGQGSPGTWLSIMLSDVDQYYEAISEKGAQVLQPPQDREWGLREMLVQDPDQHIIRFGQGISIRAKSEHSMPPNIRVVPRVPTPAEYRRLVGSVGWNVPASEQIIEDTLAAPVYAVVAEDTTSNDAIGCVLLLGDHASFYYVKDVIVHPNWQNRQVGTAMMHLINHWLDANAPDQALVGLYTGDNLAPFYNQFGFHPGFGMTRRIRK